MLKIGRLLIFNDAQKSKNARYAVIWYVIGTRDFAFVSISASSAVAIRQKELFPVIRLDVLSLMCRIFV